MQTPIDRRLVLLTISIAILAAGACAGGSGPGSSVAPPPQPSTGAAMGPGALRPFLVDRLGPLWYCDRDSSPVARDEQQAAIDGYATMVADAEVFPAVAAKLGIDPAASPSDAQKLQLYRLWKVASAVALEPIGSGRYRFDYLARPVGAATQGTRTTGVIEANGGLTVEQQSPANAPMCPICLSIGTPIEAPGGAIAVDRLRIGATIWTLDRDGHRVTGTVVALGSTPAPAGHHVIRLTLADGRSVTASPGHPLADGRRVADLRIGDEVDGSAVRSVAILAYAAASTYDLVVSGDTGVYLAGGIPLGSTIEPGR